jgi:hypothetical protein
MWYAGDVSQRTPVQCPMAKKRAPRMPATKAAPKRVGKPVRLDLSDELHERIKRQAGRLGLTKASYARMALMRQLQADEEGEK